MSDHSAYTENELLVLIKEGSYPAFTEIYDRHWHLLFGSAYNILRDREACLDILQDIFVWFWENRETWELTSCKGYLLTAVKFKTANYIRNSKNRESIINHLGSVELDHAKDEPYEVRQLEELIKSIATQLPDRCREIFQMSRYGYLSNKEIATKLNISEKTVENQLTIALKRLRQKLSTSYFWML
ncbi:MAG: RNA polymerase sigma-70 factor [Pedobacter sp.]|nr:RNA polymerase sigma-70 factor [Pedobacter sp.]MDQ8051561.1 RNA polymerase sigma-70 factor [Pedobacter sp.]